MIPTTSAPETIGGQPSQTQVHIVLVEPLIPPNTGNVARLCAATGAWLHLVGPMGFELDHRKVKRAGLDYWPHVTLSVYADFESFASRLNLASAYFFSKFAGRSYHEVDYPSSPVLVFGSETAGLGEARRQAYADALVRIPIRPDVRSLNLSNAVSVGLYEVLRQQWERTAVTPWPGIGKE